jgi:hypothetical protein
MQSPVTLIDEIRREYFADFALGGSAHQFVTKLDKRLNQIYEEAVDRYYKAPPWAIPGVQMAICCYFAWGEVRSVESFSRQAMELGFDKPRLRLLLSKQIYEEMVHHQMFREAAIKIWGIDPVKIPQPPELMAMFDAYDVGYGSNDILEKIFYSQFCSERAVMPSYKRFKESLKTSRGGLHPLIEKAFDRVLHDEPGHVAIGRLVACELADRGTAQRERMVEMAADIVGITVNLWKTGNRGMNALFHLGLKLIEAKILHTKHPGALANTEWHESPTT